MGCSGVMEERERERRVVMAVFGPIPESAQKYVRKNAGIGGGGCRMVIIRDADREAFVNEVKSAGLKVGRVHM